MTKRITLALLLPALVGLFLSGCALSKNRLISDIEKLSQVPEGSSAPMSRALDSEMPLHTPDSSSTSSLFSSISNIERPTRKTVKNLDQDQISTKAPEDLIHDARLHMIAVNRRGQPIDPVDDGILSKEAYEAQVAKIAEAVKRTRPRKGIAIYVHGGMNTLQGAVARSVILTPSLQNEGYYPIFVNWQSDPISAYGDHLFWMRNGRLLPQEKKVEALLTMPLVLFADVMRGVGRVPYDIYGLAADSLKTNRNYDHYRDQQFSRLNLPENNSEMLGFDLTDTQMLGRATIYGATLPAKVVTAPLVSAIGPGAWGAMNRNARSLMLVDPVDGKQQKGAFSILLDALGNSVPKTPIDVFGHSMGAIVLNEAIAMHPRLNYRDIVYMAPACSLHSVQSTVLPYLDQNKKAKFYILTLHPHGEAGEVPGHMVAGQIIHRGSLLVWIDEIFQPTRSFTDRTLGQIDNLTDASGVIDIKLKDRVFVRTFGFGAFSNKPRSPELGPQQHGQFSNYQCEFWKPGFYKPHGTFIPLRAANR